MKGVAVALQRKSELKPCIKYETTFQTLAALKYIVDAFSSIMREMVALKLLIRIVQF